MPLQELLNMLQSNESFTDSRKVLYEQMDKRIKELENSRYLDWESSDESGKGVIFITSNPHLLYRIPSTFLMPISNVFSVKPCS